MSTDPNATPAPAPSWLPASIAGPLAWAKRNHAFIAWTLAMIGWGIHAYQSFKAGTSGSDVPPPPPAIQQPAPPAEAVAFGQGWVNDPDEVASIVQQLPPTLRVFSDTPAGQVQDLPKFVYGWKAYEQLFARPPPVKNQGQVGSCVSFGTNTAIERTLAAEIVRRKGASGEWSRFTEEATYGGSRVEIGGGKIRGDGSVGAWAAQFVTKYGCVPRRPYPQQDLTSYSESLCRKWGSSGVPAVFEGMAKQYPVKSFVQVKVWEEAKAALAQGYMIAVCSNQGFASKRNANGVAAAQGNWGHCMAIDGYQIEGAKEYGHIVNSWGTDWISGPTGWGNPGGDGFWADATVIDRMLKQGDSWAFSGVTGFPARRVIDWNVLAPQAPHHFRDVTKMARLTLRPEATLAW